MDNIIPSGRRRRIVNGLILATVALATAVLLLRNGASAVWFSIVFLLVLLASLMLLQARDKT